MKLFSQSLLRIAAIGALTLSAGVAQAHPGHGAESLSDGLLHPFGLDHLLAMLAVGVWSVSALPAHKAWWGPATFMLALMAGAALGAAGVTLPMLESSVSLSVVMLGAMLVLARHALPTAAGLGLVAASAALHGLAHGAEAPASGFAPYALGFLLTTGALHVGGMLAGVGIRRYLAGAANLAYAGLGTLCGAAGLYLASQA